MTPETEARIYGHVRLWTICNYIGVAVVLFIARPLDFLLAVIIQMTLSGLLKR
jgi:hypothetical protein